VLHVPVSNRLALFEGAVELDERCAAEFASVGAGYGDVPRAFALYVCVLDEFSDFRCRCVHGAKTEDIEKKNAAVV